MYIDGINLLKRNMLETIKMEADSIRYSSECISYNISKEEMNKHLSRYKYKKGFVFK